MKVSSSQREKQSQNQTCLGDRLQKLDPTTIVRLNPETKIPSMRKFPRQLVSCSQAEGPVGPVLQAVLSAWSSPASAAAAGQLLKSGLQCAVRSMPWIFSSPLGLGYEHQNRQAQFRADQGQGWEFDPGEPSRLLPVPTQNQGSAFQWEFTKNNLMVDS